MALCGGKEIPVDVFQWMLTFLSMQELCECSQVSQFWHQYTSYYNSNNTRIWKDLLMKEFGETLHLQNNIDIRINNDIYRYCKLSQHILNAVDNDKYNEIVKIPKESNLNKAMNENGLNDTVKVTKSTIWGKKKKKLNKMRVITNEDIINGIRILIYFEFCIRTLDKDKCQWILLSLNKKRLKCVFRWFAKKVHNIWWDEKKYAL